MKAGYPLFSELFLAVLVLDLVLNYGHVFVHCRRCIDESPTLALKISLLVYLLVLGAVNFEARIVARMRGEEEPLAWSFYGTCAQSL
jgi:hypothetical protein